MEVQKQKTFCILKHSKKIWHTLQFNYNQNRNSEGQIK